MARHYEYVIHGRPVSDSVQPVLPHKTLSTSRDHRPKSNLRSLYRDSTSPADHAEQLATLRDRAVSSPTTPQFPPTPPAAEEEAKEDLAQGQETKHSDEGEKLRAIPITPVNVNNPPTPDHTPPRGHLKVPIRPYLAVRPSIASTRAESFKTAYEHVYSDEEADIRSPELTPVLGPALPTEVPNLNGGTHPQEQPKDYNEPADSHNREEALLEDSLAQRDGIHSSEHRLSDKTVVVDDSTPVTQHKFDHLDAESSTRREEELAEGMDANSHRDAILEAEDQAATIHEKVTIPTEKAPKREKTLRDRLKARKTIQLTPSTEAFANVIGWNDGGVREVIEEPAMNRWSGISNPSAVEAYVVESPIKPRKRGTLRKVIKNDSLRSVSSPIPQSNRTSLQSTSDSPHRLVHKKQKLNNQNRWSVGSDISKRSLSWGSGPTSYRAEVIKVAVIPEGSSSRGSSASSSRRHSRSISGTFGNAYTTMPPVSTPLGRRKRALSGSYEKNLSGDRPPIIPVRSSSLSAPTSRSHSRANSVTSQQVAIQREQAEKDLRTTLERMESERMSASLRRSSHQSSSTPAPRPDRSSDVSASGDVADILHLRNMSSAAASDASRQRQVTIELNGITPGTKEWAELRPATTLTGTPFSQTSALSTSPEIIEARVINFFPHNNESLQLIEPNRLSETPAVKALRDETARRSQTVPTGRLAVMNITTPRTSDQAVVTEAGAVDSPLRNPRKPPEPPQVQFAVISATQQSEVNYQYGPTPDTSPIKSKTGSTLRNRPQMQGRDRSESFIKTLSRGISLRNAKNPKADQELDSTMHPFWRPRPFWDDKDYQGRMQQEREREEAQDVADTELAKTRAVTVLDPSQTLKRSNSIATGPVSVIRRISERRRQRRMVDEHIAQQQALVRQGSFSSLQRLQAGHKLFGVPALRSMSLNAGIGRLSSLRDRMSTVRARREDDKAEQRREKLRKSIGAEVVPQSDSRFPSANNEMKIEHLGGRKVGYGAGLGEMLEAAKAEDLVERRGLRL